MFSRVSALAAAAALTYCVSPAAVQAASPIDAQAIAPVRPEIYRAVTLTADLAALDARETHDGEPVIDAAGIMDDLFWQQAYPAIARRCSRASRTLRRAASPRSTTGPGTGSPATRRSCRRGPKPPGAGFYPLDMTRRNSSAPTCRAAAASTPFCGAGKRAHSRSCRIRSTGVSRSGARRAARTCGGAGGRCRPAQVPQLRPRRCAGRLRAERHGLARHEGNRLTS